MRSPTQPSSSLATDGPWDTGAPVLLTLGDGALSVRSPCHPSHPGSSSTGCSVVRGTDPGRTASTSCLCVVSYSPILIPNKHPVNSPFLPSSISGRVQEVRQSSPQLRVRAFSGRGLGPVVQRAGTSRLLVCSFEVQPVTPCQWACRCVHSPSAAKTFVGRWCQKRASTQQLRSVP